MLEAPSTGRSGTKPGFFSHIALMLGGTGPRLRQRATPANNTASWTSDADWLLCAKAYHLINPSLTLRSPSSSSCNASICVK